MKKPNAKLELLKAGTTLWFKNKYVFDTEEESKQSFDELKEEALNNKIEWKKPDGKSAYDGSTLNRHIIDGWEFL